MRPANVLLILGIVFSSISYASDPTNAQDNDVQYCENVESTLSLYENDDQVYINLEHKALVKAVEKLYEKQLQEIPSAVFSYDTIVDKLTSTINIKSAQRYSQGLFNPCVTIKEPTISAQDIARFKKTAIARICKQEESKALDSTTLPQQHFIERLKNFSTNSDAGLESMINNPTKIAAQSDEDLYSLIHQETKAIPSNQSLPDVKCLELYVYPVEIFVASS